jgi:hypothetical protein
MKSKSPRISNSFSREEIEFMYDLLTAVKQEESIRPFVHRKECAKVFRKVMSMLTKMRFRHGKKTSRAS